MSPFASVLLLDRIPFPQGNIDDRLPLFHATGFATSGVNLALGNRLVLRRRFDAEQTVATMAAEKVEMLVAVPTMLHRMVALGPEVLGVRPSALKVIVIAGSALSPAVSEAIQDAFGDVLYNLYGSTEVAIASIAQPHELRQAPGTVGRAPISSRLRLYDADDNQITAPNVRGRLFVKNGVLFEGYTDGRNKAIIDGYMSTGDMARFDADGLMFIEGRDDDMIVSGGENVYPLEVENLLAEHSAVDDVAVIGVPDDEFRNPVAGPSSFAPRVPIPHPRHQGARQDAPRPLQGAPRCGVCRRTAPQSHRQTGPPAAPTGPCDRQFLMRAGTARTQIAIPTTSTRVWRQ